VIGVLTRTISLYALAYALAAILAFLASSGIAAAQGTNTIYDEAGVLSDSEEQQVQEEFDAAREDAGQPLYAFLIPDTGVDDQADQRKLVEQEASEENLPQDAGVIVVAPNDGWVRLANIDGTSEQAVYETMRPDFQEGDFAAGLIAGAREIQGEPVASQDDPGAGGGLPGGGLLVLLVGVIGVILLLRNRHSNKRRIEEERRSAEGEFADLTTRLDEFGEKERLVSGYLEAQRPLLDQRTEERVEAELSDARTAEFAQEFNEAASRLTSDPVSARERIRRGRGSLEDSVRKLDEVEKTIDDYRAADEALDGKLGAAAEEIRAAEEAQESARAAGVAAKHLDLRPEYDRLAREAADRAVRRDEYDPRQAFAAVDALAQRARERRTALREEISSRDALPEERLSAQGALGRARQALEEYHRSYEKALSEFGPAALGEAPNPGELSSGLLHAEGCIEGADSAASAGRFAEARGLLREATDLARETMQAPSRLKVATAQADRKKRAGEEKLVELEARLAQAKANEHLMNPYQRQRLREYEYQLENARYGFFGGDWLTALLLF